MKYYAHSKEGEPIENWQLLEDHLANVAKLAADFAEKFDAGEWGRIVGLWHDLGKGTRPWQAYLRYANKIVDGFSKFYNGHPQHAALGAQYLHQHSKEAGKLLAYCIAGHHGGLPNWEDSSDSALKMRLQKEYPEIRVSLNEPPFFSSIPLAEINEERFGFQLQFFVRMLFSSLVDADYLDTEQFIDEKKANWRSVHLSLESISPIFWEKFNKLRADATDTEVNRQREIVLEDCLAKAKEDAGLFSLTVPTGGGKTLASLAFALEHARKHNKCRIIYVIPFTSIIEQTAKVFRDILGDDAVLEHHCNFIFSDSDWQTRLASENWDAPIVVTTNVQFFNSFYANKSSKCRKLHNVSNSIVIFDEIQAIPVEKLKPCLEVIKELSLNYGVTSVLCTATQPAIEYSKQFKSGLQNVREIVQDITTLFSAMKRTKEFFIGELSEDDVANRLSEHQQVLCVVNTRQQALDIFDALPESNENIHLSALMYPAHRTKKLDEVRQRLENGLPCRVVSTQLIEAGVDIDFSAVYRAVAGIDSIAQAAGRCNRNGLHNEPCKVFVFEFPKESSCTFFRQAAQSAAKLFERFSGKFTSPECVREYFADFFWKNEQRMDSDGIIERCILAQSGNIQFRDIAEFQMIKSASIPIIIALEDPAINLVNSLEFATHKRGILRKLQQFTVQVYKYQLDEFKDWIESPMPDVLVLRLQELYSDKTGLECKAPENNAFFG